MKQCTSCKEIKPKSQFLKDNKTKDGLRYECKLCHNLRNRLWHKNNKERGKNTYLKRQYGITLQEKLEMVKSQDNKCGICIQEYDNNQCLKVPLHMASNNEYHFICIRCYFHLKNKAVCPYCKSKKLLFYGFFR